MFLAKIATKRPVLTTTIILVFILFGVFAYISLNLDTFPEVKVPYVTITTIYPGAGPKEVENLITKPIEDEIATISGIERIESYSLENSSIILIEFKLGKDVDVANREVKDQVEKILFKLPSDAKKPIIQKLDVQAFPIINLVVFGKNNISPIELYEICDKRIKDRLSQIPGVANVEIVGGQERAIRVEFDNRQIFENSISLPQMAQILKSYNIDLPGGLFQTGKDEFTVRVKGEFPTVDAIRNLQIPTPFGVKKLSQIANVSDTGKDVRYRAVFFNLQGKESSENAVNISIVKSADANAVRVSEQVTEILPEIEKSMPEGIRIVKVYDGADFTRATFNDTMSNIYLGVIFTGLVMFLFLFSIRSTFVVAISMPVSIASSFLLFKAFGLTLNILSLMGISVSIGVLVANSVVVLENIFRLRNLGYSPKDAAYFGTSEVTVAVLASTLTNLIVFLPIANMSSIVGKFLKDLALAATFTTLFSLFISFTLTPMLASLFLRKEEKESVLTKFYHKVDGFLNNSYKLLLQQVLKTKKRSVALLVLVIVVFLLTAFLFAPRIGLEFIPQVDNNLVQIQIELPENYNLEATTQKVNEVFNRIKNHPEIISVFGNIGKKDNLNTGSNLASITVKLCDSKDRQVSIDDMIRLIINDIRDIPNIKTIVRPGEFISGLQYPIQFYILGQDIDTLEKYKEIVVQKLKDVPGLINFDNSSRKGKPEITITPRRDLLPDIGLTLIDLAYTVRAAVDGIEATTFREGGNEYDIVITLKDEDVDLPNKIENITIVSPKGTYRLNQVANIEYTTSVSRILHRDKFKAIQFIGSNAPGIPLGNVTNEIEKRMSEINLPSGYSFKWAGNVKFMKDMFRDMVIAFIIATFLTYMLLAAILESFWQPVYIMITVPLGLIGVFIAMFLFGTTYNISSLMGIIMLIGIVVNNAILILDYSNQLVREKGVDVKDAVLEASVVRLKPQIISSFALILGMLPMALQIGEAGKELRAPLGIVSIAGLLVATLLTIFVIPAFYYIFSKGKIRKD
ncbi:MAG: Efflux RND transporter permease subunit [Candidatus Kapaibacterium sp.]|nr:MAG: Efflux RND transporter permease subunit [Candidatus Kapabacteria bacterium]